MFFLLRVAFWLSIVILLLPGDPSTGDKAPRVTAFEALSAAETTVSDFSRFCDRNPDVCVTGGNALEVFGEKVRYGAKMLYGYFGDRAGENDAVPAKGTLTPDDVQPAWHAPAKGDGAA
jgi:hypothetical protein